MQEFEYLFDEDNAPSWKANNYPRRKVQKGWLTAVVLSALLFFLVGISVSRWILPVPDMREIHTSQPHTALPPAHPFAHPL